MNRRRRRKGQLFRLLHHRGHGPAPIFVVVRKIALPRSGYKQDCSDTPFTVFERFRKRRSQKHSIGLLAAGMSGRYIAAMKVREADILIVPGQSNSDPAHWQSRWQARLSTARRVEQADWEAPERAAWAAEIAAAVNEAEKPVVLVAHSLGIAAAVQALPAFRQRVAGAFFVAPLDLETSGDRPEWLAPFGPYPRDPLPFPSTLIASRIDPWCDYNVAEDIAAAWGSFLIDAGEAGHINTEAGFGPWPEGSMVFAQFLSRLS